MDITSLIRRLALAIRDPALGAKGLDRHGPVRMNQAAHRRRSRAAIDSHHHQRKLIDNDLCFAVDKIFVHFIAQLLTRLD